MLMDDECFMDNKEEFSFGQQIGEARELIVWGLLYGRNRSPNVLRHLP